LLVNETKLVSIQKLVRYSSVNVHRGTSKAEASLKQYLSPWPRELQQIAQSSQSKPMEVPQFIIGSAGKIAMHLWQAVATIEGTPALNRTEKELYVFSTFGKNTPRWRDVLHTPDAFMSFDEKLKMMTYILTKKLGCSVVFVDLMTPLLQDGTISKLAQIYTDFSEINRSHRREIDVKLVTGKKLNQASLEYYKNTISLDYLDPADNMIFTYSVDPSITGYKVYVKNKLFDFTQDDDIKRTHHKASVASAYSPKESLVKDLTGVWAPSDIDNFWLDVQQENKN